MRERETTYTEETNDGNGERNSGAARNSLPRDANEPRP